MTCPRSISKSTSTTTPRRSSRKACRSSGGSAMRLRTASSTAVSGSSRASPSTVPGRWGASGTASGHRIETWSVIARWKVATVRPRALPASAPCDVVRPLVREPGPDLPALHVVVDLDHEHLPREVEERHPQKPARTEVGKPNHDRGVTGQRELEHGDHPVEALLLCFGDEGVVLLASVRLKVDAMRGAGREDEREKVRPTHDPGTVAPNSTGGLFGAATSSRRARPTLSSPTGP